MRTKLKLMLVLLMVSTIGRAQSPTIKVMLEQIAALQVYIGHLKNTYDIAKNGLDFIGDKTGKERDLHQNYFSSLKTVSPAVSGYYRLKDCQLVYAKIHEQSDRYLGMARSAPLLQAQERQYISGVYEKLLAEADRTFESMRAVVVNNRLEMEDDERLRRIDGCYHSLAVLYNISRSFGAEAAGLIVARERQQAEVEHFRKIQGRNKK